jgi:DNA-binding transcriptional ArsR family regulator
MELVPDVFHAIAEPNRRRMLDMLAGGELAAQELADRFDISFAAVSQHLKVLHDAGLVERRAEGRRRIYSLTAERLREVDDWTANYRRFWQSRMIACARIWMNLNLRTTNARATNPKIEIRKKFERMNV